MSTIPEELVERMAQLVRKIASGKLHATNDSAECRAIAAALPKPVDPDLIAARELVADRYKSRDCPDSFVIIRTGILSGDDDDSQAVQNCLTAIRRGRELERSGK